jgi:hypothetical protein
VAVYLPETKNTIVLRSLESYGAGYVPAAETPEQHLLPAFVHEFTHLVNDQLVPVVKMQSWMSEGLAEYVAQNYRDDEVRSAYRAGTFLVLDKTEDVIEWWTDPARGYTSAQIRLAYGEAALAVTFFVERFGLDTFWDLARTFAESRKWPEAFASATGASWDQFQDDWLAWLRRRLGL